MTFAHLLESLFLLLLVAGLLGGVGRNALGWVGLLFLLYSLQYAFVNGFAGPARALHAVNALLMLLVALHLGRRQWRVFRGLPANADGPGGDRLRRNLVISILVAIPIVVLWALLTPAPTATATATTSAVESDTVSAGAGAEIFAAHCSGCHGVEGEGGFGPRLAGEVDVAAALVEQILEGGSGMPAFRNQLSDEQVAQVASYVGNSWGNDLGPVSARLVGEHR